MYPLQGRSLRLVTGRNEDEAAADSNGAGKTALVMAPLWALTGRSDARSEARQRANVTHVACHADVTCHTDTPQCHVSRCALRTPALQCMRHSSYAGEQLCAAGSAELPEHVEDAVCRWCNASMSMRRCVSAAAAQGGFGRGLTNADVVSDDCAAARVSVRGTVNGRRFYVERTVKRCALIASSARPCD